MAILELDSFPDSKAIPLGCYAKSVSSITYRVLGEASRYRDALIYVRDEEFGGKHQTVVRDVASQYWPQNATDVVIEYTPKDPPVVTPALREDTSNDFDPLAGDEPIDD